MERVGYCSKTGRELYRPAMTEDEYQQSDMVGWCLACGTEMDGVEPDARRYTCDACGEPLVYGIEQLLLMGIVDIRE